MKMEPRNHALDESEGDKTMDQNLLYIQNVNMNEIPWHRITTTYGRATKFPQCFKSICDMEDIVIVKNALNEVTSNIEHQSTLWHATPFAMIFLVRLFERAVSKRDNSEIAKFITERLLDFFSVVAVCFHDGDEMEHEDQLPLFSDMLKEEYLWSEEYDETEDLMYYEEGEAFPDDLFFSFYYYSYQVLLTCKPALQQLNSTILDTKAKELQELL